MTKGPPTVKTNSLRTKCGMRPGLTGLRSSKKLRASSAELRTNSKTEPWRWSVPFRVMISVKPAAPWPISAGMTPELERTSSTASTLKLEKVAPPISGSVVSIPSMANTVVAPRWPFPANCWVKFAAPLLSVMVPAASRSNWLKSRLLRGKVDTSFFDSCSPPLDFVSRAASVASGFWSCEVEPLSDDAAAGFDSVDLPSWPSDDPWRRPTRASVAREKANAGNILNSNSEGFRFIRIYFLDFQEELPAIHPEQHQPVTEQHGRAVDQGLEAGA